MRISYKHNNLITKGTEVKNRHIKLGSWAVTVIVSVGIAAGASAHHSKPVERLKTTTKVVPTSTIKPTVTPPTAPVTPSNTKAVQSTTPAATVAPTASPAPTPAPKSQQQQGYQQYCASGVQAQGSCTTPVGSK